VWCEMARRGSGEGVGGICDRKNQSRKKKERKTRRTIMDGAGAVNTGMHAMEGDGACKQSISALRKKKKLTTKRKASQVGE
jgi:hypothetical protein